MAANKLLNKIVEELGLVSIYRSPVDTKLLFAQRFLRLFAYGSTTLILALYLHELGTDDTKIGLFMTLTLAGDVMISFFLTVFADRLGRRVILCAGALLMTASGVVFGLSGNYWILLAAAIFGVISPSGNEIGPFRAIEESTLAHLSPPEIRSDIYAWYSLVGQLGTACGMITCGFTVGRLESLDGWSLVRAYRVIFFGYAVFGILKFGLASTLSQRVEVERIEASEPIAGEIDPLLPINGISEEGNEQKKVVSWYSIFPSISQESRVIVLTLCFFFGLDNLASGLVPTSWVTVFFSRKFGLREGELGSVFFTTSMIGAVSTLVAASIAKRIGNVKAMVFTHLPSSIALALVPIPSQLWLSLFFFISRSCTSMMDVGPRTAFLAAVVLPSERTVVMGTLNVVKTLCQGIGPTVTGLLAGRQLFWISFIIAGVLKATYDLGMLAVFAGHVSIEERERAARVAEDVLGDDANHDDA